jgi:hypothetical protein
MQQVVEDTALQVEQVVLMELVALEHLVPMPPLETEQQILALEAEENLDLLQLEEMDLLA